MCVHTKLRTNNHVCEQVKPKMIMASASDLHTDVRTSLGYLGTLSLLYIDSPNVGVGLAPLPCARMCTGRLLLNNQPKLTRTFDLVIHEYTHDHISNSIRPQISLSRVYICVPRTVHPQLHTSLQSTFSYRYYGSFTW